MISNKQALVFDFDGTLVDTMHIFADVASHLMSENYKISKDEARSMYFKTSGLPFFHQLEEIFPGDKKNEDVARVYEMQKLDATDDIMIDDDTHGALKSLKDLSYDLIVSSNNFHHNINNFVERNNLGEVFSLSLGFKDGFAKGKDHFLHISEEMGFENKDMLFVGDSINDARLAKESEVDFIGKVGTFSKKDFLEFDKNIKVIDNISDLIN